GIGQVFRPDLPLRLEEPWQVGIAVDRQAVGPEPDDRVQRAGEALRGLQRQAIDQVDVHRAEAGPPAFVDHGGRPGHRLDAVDRALHPLVEVLHTQAGAVETRAGEVRDVARPDVPRVELDGEIRGRAARQAQVPAHAL